MNKTFKGKAIYNPSGKAGEYSYWACNFYNGCSNGCTYCYCKKGVLAHTMGGDTPTLKKCFKDENHALEVFERELLANVEELRKHGLFFSFTTDPMLPETIGLTRSSIDICMRSNVPIKILTKNARWVDGALFPWYYRKFRNKIAFGFTITGHDELEPNASTNAERIEAMRKLYEAGFKTWASFEPIVLLSDTLNVFKLSVKYCNVAKIGLMSGKKYDKAELQWFIQQVIMEAGECKIYFKDTLLQQAGVSRESLPANCVGRDYSIFNEQQ